jgi:hypothetical protein
MSSITDPRLWTIGDRWHRDLYPWWDRGEVVSHRRILHRHPPHSPGIIAAGGLAPESVGPAGEALVSVSRRDL